MVWQPAWMRRFLGRGGNLSSRPAVVLPPRPLELLVTLWPSFPHFASFANDPRLAGIRLNSAMMDQFELDHELEIVAKRRSKTPLFFDVKGRQLRIQEVHPFPDHLEVTLNHPVEFDFRGSTPVLFKAGSDSAELVAIQGEGERLVFRGGPRWNVKVGESLHIRDHTLRVKGPLFTDAELLKIERVRRAGFKHWFLSYVEEQRDIDQFLELVGHDAEVWLKIESRQGLEFVARHFQKRPNLTLVAARGDLYVEVDRPHEVLAATKLIIEKDPEACVGSRVLLSVIPEPVPSCADFSELAWLYDIGYRRIMLCDELCLKGDLLKRAVNVFDAFRESYTKTFAQSVPGAMTSL